MESATQPIKPYRYVLLQKGTLPLAPDGAVNRSVEHQCTSALIWPEGDRPRKGNTVLTDPCFTAKGFEYARSQLERLNMSFQDIGRVFVTHRHYDHLPNLARFLGPTTFRTLQVGMRKALLSLTMVPYPGHSPDLRALLFHASAHQKVCIVGDAILDVVWLKAWGYYWPNGYGPHEIMQTWESVAHILAQADVIVPGHGEPFTVTAGLVQELLVTFASAEYADDCQQVAPILASRLKHLLAG